MPSQTELGSRSRGKLVPWRPALLSQASVTFEFPSVCGILPLASKCFTVENIQQFLGSVQGKVLPGDYGVLVA